MGKFIKVTDNTTGLLITVNADQIEKVVANGSGSDIYLSQDSAGTTVNESLETVNKLLNGETFYVMGADEAYTPTTSTVTFTITNSAGGAALEDVTITFNGESKDTNASGVAIFTNVLYGVSKPYSLVKASFTTVADVVTVDGATEAVADTMTAS